VVKYTGSSCSWHREAMSLVRLRRLEIDFMIGMFAPFDEIDKKSLSPNFDKIKNIFAPHVTPYSRVWLDRGGLPSETFKSGSLERGESVGDAEGGVLRMSASWLIAHICCFKFSSERPHRSWG